MYFYRYYIKSLFDFVVTLILILFCSPVLITLIIILFFYNYGTPFYLQPRPGIHDRIFKIIKFKTMNDKKDTNGELLPAAQRLTALGKFIRKISIDELPQLLNVLKGDMSLIGPRPLLVEYLELYNDIQKRRHEVKPGITGLAQVKGRNAVDWEDKFKLDVWYVDHISFCLDMKIIWLTIMNVIKREGIGVEGSRIGSVIQGPFKGNVK